MHTPSNGHFKNHLTSECQLLGVFSEVKNKLVKKKKAWGQTVNVNYTKHVMGGKTIQCSKNVNSIN